MDSVDLSAAMLPLRFTFVLPCGVCLISSAEWWIVGFDVVMPSQIEIRAVDLPGPVHRSSSSCVVVVFFSHNRFVWWNLVSARF